MSRDILCDAIEQDKHTSSYDDVVEVMLNKSPRIGDIGGRF